jgi:hypothetical protein
MNELDKEEILKEFDSWIEKTNGIMRQYPTINDYRNFLSEILDRYEPKPLREDRIFINHIQSHLKEGEEVICKICGKTAKVICENEKELRGKQMETFDGLKYVILILVGIGFILMGVFFEATDIKLGKPEKRIELLEKEM